MTNVAFVPGNREIDHHQFEQATRSEAYGTEVDLIAAMAHAESLTGLIKAASYSASSDNDSGAGATEESAHWACQDDKFPRLEPRGA